MDSNCKRKGTYQKSVALYLLDNNPSVIFDHFKIILKWKTCKHCTLYIKIIWETYRLEYQFCSKINLFTNV